MSREKKEASLLWLSVLQRRNLDFRLQLTRVALILHLQNRPQVTRVRLWLAPNTILSYKIFRIVTMHLFIFFFFFYSIVLIKQLPS